MNVKYMDMKTMSIEVNDEFAKVLGEIEPLMDGHVLIKNFLLLGLKQYRIELAVKKYLGGEVSTWKAAEIADTSFRRMNKILQEKGVGMHYSDRSLKEDLE
uniref:Uncharacterized protein n=1 Tax=Candidatus Methanogaster sp. ANME-2c ERB4 TaxID=2759911 RepID=A0A7G9YJ26_9EURY|nr:hypothetical protein DCDENBEB_00001 [Methanosarcinales archaeon ANME-2c ERB4]